MGRSRRWTRLFLLGAVLLAGCGNDDDTEGDVRATSTGQPATTAAPTTPDVAQTDPAGASTLPGGIVIATSEFIEDDIDRPEPTAGPTPTQPPPIHSNFDNDGDGTYSSEEFVQAITALYPTYSWPDQHYISLDEILRRLSGRLEPNMQHEAPGEYTVIGRWNECAWGLTFLGAFRDGDDGLMAESLSHLRQILDMNPLALPETIATRGERYDRAELGDVAPLQNSVTVSCDVDAFTQRPAAAIRPVDG